GAVAGLGAGLVGAFWVGIGSIVTRSSGAKRLPPSCHINTTAAFQTAIGNVTSRPTGLHRFYSLSYMWYAGFSCLIVILVGLTVSFLTGPMKEGEATPGTVYPLLGKLLFFLPEHRKKNVCCVTPLRPAIPSPQGPRSHKESNGTTSGQHTPSQQQTERLLPDADSRVIEYETAV
ncbi:sodium-dependent multivitamin transporter-like, partial [Poecilia latipinna]